MKYKSAFFPALPACLAVALSSTAFAEIPNQLDATKPGYNEGDLLMGFRVTAGAGAGTCYVVNIGSAATYRDATTAITVGSLGNINADLQAYGAGWQTRTDLFWSIAGSPSNTATVNGDPANTLYFSRAQTSVGTSGAAPVIESETNRGGVSTRMTAVQSGFWDIHFNSGTPGVAPHTPNSIVAAFQGEADPYAWRLYMAPGGQSSNTPGGTDFGTGQNIEGNATKTLSLFRMTDGNGASYEGYFGISASGVLTFTPLVLQSYSSWASTNAGGQAADLDFDGDGLENGAEFFMGTAGNAFTTNPAPQAGLITWPRAAGRDSSAVVKVSTDLVNWTTATSNVTISAGSVTYQLPASTTEPKQFVRLQTTP